MAVDAILQAMGPVGRARELCGVPVLPLNGETQRQRAERLDAKARSLRLWLTESLAEFFTQDEIQDGAEILAVTMWAMHDGYSAAREELEKRTDIITKRVWDA